VADFGVDKSFCHFCHIAKSLRGSLNKKEGVRKCNLLGMINVIIDESSSDGQITAFILMLCPLHAKLRIVSNLLQLYCKTTAELMQVQSKLQELPGNSNFQFRMEKPGKISKLLLKLNDFPDIEDEYELDQPRVEVPFLNGTQCNLLLNHFPRLFPLKASERKIWILTRYLFKYWVDASPERIATQNISDLNQTLDQLQQLLTLTFPTEKFSFYWHILIAHLPDLIREYGSVSQFSNQGSS
jgi:hypothetical protein